MKRSAGILLHITSLYDQYGCGTFGSNAYHFVDLLKEAIVDILMHNNFIRLKDSSSFKQNRFYFCLPENLNGVFELSRDNHIYNNYICPGILKWGLYVW